MTPMIMRLLPGGAPPAPLSASSPLRGAPAGRTGGPIGSPDRREPEDAVYTIVEESFRPAARKTHKKTTAGGAHASARRRGLAVMSLPAGCTPAQRAALRAYAPYDDYLGTLVDLWA